MRFLGKVGLGCVLGAASAHAYLPYEPNEYVIEEVADQPYRLFPKSERYAFAIDADFYKPAFIGDDQSKFYRYDYYHGNGYWITSRAEFRPVHQLTLNLKANITQGTSSNGPTYMALIVPMAALTYEEKLLGLDFQFRLSDINRQTIGTGLFIELKETEGGYIIASNDWFNGKLMVDGTGSFRLEGGVVALDLNAWQGLLGTTFFLQETETAYHPPQFMGSFYSKHTFENGMGYGAEFGLNENAIAWMAYGDYHATFFERLNFWFKPQFRYYGKNILGTLPGKVAHNYISYDQNDKPFTLPMDIFAFGDHVNAYSAQLNLEYIFNIFYRVYAETEFIHWVYHDQGLLQQMYFRTGFKFYPFKGREDQFGILIANKYLIASTSQVDLNSPTRTFSPPNGTDLENKPLFIQQLYFMINFTTHL